jgi:hypothetical protein
MAASVSKEDVLDIMIHQDGEESAENIAAQLELSSEGAEKTRNTILDFIRSYRAKRADQSDAAWLQKEFSNYPDVWGNAEEIKNAAEDIVANVEMFASAQEELEDHFSKGLSRNNWLAGKIEQGAIAEGIADVGAYADNIDHILDLANAENINVIYCNNGSLNQQRNLDGFLAEHHHANTFNIHAASKGSSYRAEVLEPAPGKTYGKNSVDIVIRDGSGNIVRRYQSKYGRTSEATADLFTRGDYRGQRKLVPKGQSEDITGSTDSIEMDGIRSRPLSKEEARELQTRAQQRAEAPKHDWNEASRVGIAKSIGAKAGKAALLSVGFQGARILGRRIWNGLSGKPNPDVEEDLREFVQTSLHSAAASGFTVAVAGGVATAAKSGWLGKVLKSTPAGRIANAVCIGVANVRILCDLARGEISGQEALDKAGNATCSLVGGLCGAGKGASLGAALGTVLGPVGTAVGGVVGGVVGGIAGSSVAEALYEGGKKIVSAAGDLLRSAASAVSDCLSSVSQAFCSLFGF